MGVRGKGFGCVEWLKGATIRLENLTICIPKINKTKMCIHTKAQVRKAGTERGRRGREAPRGRVAWVCCPVCWKSLDDVWAGDMGECRDTGRNRRVGAGAVGGGEGGFSPIVDELPPVPGVGVPGGQLRGSDQGRE